VRNKYTKWMGKKLGPNMSVTKNILNRWNILYKNQGNTNLWECIPHKIIFSSNRDLQLSRIFLKHGRDNASIPELKELEHKDATVSAEKREKRK
jgi:hypothetical protein